MLTPQNVSGLRRRDNALPHRGKATEYVAARVALFRFVSGPEGKEESERLCHTCGTERPKDWTKLKADIDQQKNPAAARQRAYRQRFNRGEMALTIRVKRKVTEALLVAERVTDKESRDRKKLSAELAAVLEEWASHWVKK